MIQRVWAGNCVDSKKAIQVSMAFIEQNSERSGRDSARASTPVSKQPMTAMESLNCMKSLIENRISASTQFYSFG